MVLEFENLGNLNSTNARYLVVNMPPIVFHLVGCPLYLDMFLCTYLRSTIEAVVPESNNILIGTVSPVLSWILPTTSVVWCSFFLFFVLFIAKEDK